LLILKQENEIACAANSNARKSKRRNQIKKDLKRMQRSQPERSGGE
jgi:Flp pilus assembly protein TadB